MAAVLPQALASPAMKRPLIALAFAASTLAFAQPPDRPNTPVFRSGPWFVVRSVRPGEVVACTGFYRANRHVQLSKDMLIIKTAEEVKGVGFAFDSDPVSAARPLSGAEKELKAIAFTGDDFSKLSKSRKVRIEVATPQGTMRHDLELEGLAGALDNINAGCPLPPAQPVRGRPRMHG
jgi:hypothetical protein